ncbi:MAG: hypothetical protein GY715_16995 [Planctomycetes bacterium]|nr:hypothetical protein [Planctomycetota bacterium]
MALGRSTMYATPPSTRCFRCARCLGTSPLAAIVAIVVASVTASVHADDFDAAGDDSFQSTALFKVTISPEVPVMGGTTHVLWLRGPTCVVRSDAHSQGSDPSGPMGDGTLCAPASPTNGTSDGEIGPFPRGFNSGGGDDEVHTDLVDMLMTNATGWEVRTGASALTDCAHPLPGRNLGEVEARGGSGFPADSFFNLYVQVVAPNGMRLFNPTPLMVQTKGITRFPPFRFDYRHGFEIVGRVRMYDCDSGCFIGFLEQGTHGVRRPESPPEPPPSLHELLVRTPEVFSVDEDAEGLLVPDPCGLTGHPEPNDLYGLGTAGVWGFPTQGELFQSSGLVLGFVPDVTNVDRISAALGIGPAPIGGPPYLGPFAPNSGRPNPFPVPPSGPGTLGLQPGDNVTSLSFGFDGGNVLLFSVDPAALGVGGSAVRFPLTDERPHDPLIGQAEQWRW